jgi:hypothetical protein
MQRLHMPHIYFPALSLRIDNDPSRIVSVMPDVKQHINLSPLAAYQSSNVCVYSDAEVGG